MCTYICVLIYIGYRPEKNNTCVKWCKKIWLCPSRQTCSRTLNFCGAYIFSYFHSYFCCAYIHIFGVHTYFWCAYIFLVFIHIFGVYTYFWCAYIFLVCIHIFGVHTYFPDTKSDFSILVLILSAEEKVSFLHSMHVHMQRKNDSLNRKYREQKYRHTFFRA
jgi:hypothetical protein